MTSSTPASRQPATTSAIWSGVPATAGAGPTASTKRRAPRGVVGEHGQGLGRAADLGRIATDALAAPVEHGGPLGEASRAGSTCSTRRRSGR